MSKSILIVLQLVLAINAILSASVASEKGFIHIGSFKSLGSIQGRSGGKLDENDYYVSVNSASWSMAESDCKAVFGESASAVSIETLDEWEFLKITLESYGLGVTYWTSGIYDPTAKVWKWSGNNQALLSYAPWASGHPLPNPSSVYRVMFTFDNRYSASWQTVSYTQQHRYICEVAADPCYKSNDLIILLESSKSVTSTYSQIAKTLLVKLANAFTVLSSNRIGYAYYYEKAIYLVDIKNTFPPAEISKLIGMTPFMNGLSYTDMAIDSAIAQFNSSPRQVPLNIVVVSDGTSDSVANSIAAAANRAINMGIRTYAVGITTTINQQELLAITGGDSRRVFTETNFDELINLLVPGSLPACAI